MEPKAKEKTQADTPQNETKTKSARIKASIQKYAKINQVTKCYPTITIDDRHP